jgi:hypothetical protein
MIVAVTTVSAPVWGDDSPTALATDCVDDNALREHIEERLGRALAAGEVGELHIELAGQGELVATFALSAQGKRALKASSCGELADAIALIVARNTPAVVATSEVESEPVLEVAPSVATPIAVHEPIRRAAWRASVTTAVLGGAGMLPGNQLGGEIAASVARDQAFVELGYVRWSAVSLPDEVGHVDFGLWTID